ncbi:MAG: CapA family protein [Myxococcota bacterium]
MRRIVALLLLAGCDPYAAWPDPHDVFPWGVAPEEDLPDYALVRVETETWTPLVDLPETAMYIQKSVEHKPSAPAEELQHFAVMRSQLPALQAGPRLSLVGDVMRFSGNWAHFADDAAPLLDGDLRAGNLETPVSDLHPVDRPSWPPTTASTPSTARQAARRAARRRAGHEQPHHRSRRCRPGAHPRARRRLGAAARGRRRPAGAGAGRRRDRQLVAFTWGLNAHGPTAHDLHVVPFGHLGERIDLAPIRAAVQAARDDGADVVAVMVHWGYEYEYYPDPHFLQLGRRIVSLGADLVVGSGPHAVEPAEICEVNRPLAPPGRGRCSVRDDRGLPRTAAILYSLGDFGTALATVPLQVGLVASVSLDPDRGVTGLGWQAVASVAEGGGQRLVPLEDLADDPAYADEAARLAQLLGVRWRR